MAITYKYDNLTGQVITNVNGVIDSADVINYFSELFNDSKIESGFIEIVRFNVDDFILRFSDLDKLKIASSKLLTKGHKITLFCAYDNFSQNVSKMIVPLFVSINLSLEICTTKDALNKYLSLLNHS